MERNEKAGWLGWECNSLSWVGLFWRQHSAKAPDLVQTWRMSSGHFWLEWQPVMPWYLREDQLLRRCCRRLHSPGWTCSDAVSMSVKLWGMYLVAGAFTEFVYARWLCSVMQALTAVTTLLGWNSTGWPKILNWAVRIPKQFSITCQAHKWQ